MTEKKVLNHIVVDLICIIWDMFPDEFNQVVWEADYIHKDSASEYVCDNHDPCW